MKNYKHLVMDIETLGVEPGSAVVAIGAVVIQARSDLSGEAVLGMFEGFIETVDACQYGTMDPSTVAWWAKQDTAVRGKVMGGKQTTRQVLEELYAFIAKHKPDYVWGKSPSFDLEMLKALSKKVGIKWPLNFRQERCSRSLLWLAQEYDINVSDAYSSLRPHDPLSDAYADARAILLILSKLGDVTT